tara:strand:- start:504 stop:665 length:162 start_codon:yes stop_codon:yes gene_type:complete
METESQSEQSMGNSALARFVFSIRPFGDISKSEKRDYKTQTDDCRPQALGILQ